MLEEDLKTSKTAEDALHLFQALTLVLTIFNYEIVISMDGIKNFAYIYIYIYIYF